MKKLLSLLSVLTISGTAVPTTIAASPYKFEINNLRNKRQTTTTINFNPTQINFETNHDEIIKLMQLLGIVVGNTSFTFYEYTDLNITKHTNIKKWSDLVNKFNFIKIGIPNLITFALQETDTEVKLSSFNPNDVNISSLAELRHGYENRGVPFEKIQLGAKTQYKPQDIRDLPFNNYSQKLYDESMWYGVSYNNIKIHFSAVKLIPNNDNDDLILRLVYRIKYTYIASSNGIKLGGTLNNGNITLIKK